MNNRFFIIKYSLFIQLPNYRPVPVECVRCSTCGTAPACAGVASSGWDVVDGAVESGHHTVVQGAIKCSNDRQHHASRYPLHRRSARLRIGIGPTALPRYSVGRPLFRSVLHQVVSTLRLGTRCRSPYRASERARAKSDAQREWGRASVRRCVTRSASTAPSSRPSAG